jgi:hypothetical protein
MTRQQTRAIREEALEDDDLKANARLLLTYIIDWHHKDKGCVMHDSTLADRLGVSRRTVMRRRQELQEAGYLRVIHGAHRRELVPQHPRTDVEAGDISVQGCDTRDESSDNSVTGGCDTRDGDMRSYNPEGTRESAPAHEDPVDDTPEEVFTSLVKIWRSVSNAPPMSEKIEDVLWGWAHDQKIPDLSLFRDVLEEQAANTTSKGCGLSPGILLREYRGQLQSGKLEPWQQENDNYSVDEQGRVCFKGHPVDELGPQNLAADLEGAKDGAPSEPPEVSA